MVLRISADLARRRGVEQRGCPRMALLPGQAAPPDEAVTDRDEARWLGEQLSRLSERERQVFERRAAGLSAAETAHVLQLSYKAVESAFTRARHRLRLWAVTGAVLFGDLLRRLRQRPGVLTAAVLAVSAGCLIASGPGTHSPRLGAGATRNRAPLASWFSLAPRPAPNDGLGSEVRSWPAATGRGRAAPGEPGPSGASTGPAPTPTPTVEVRTPPVDGPGGNPIIGSTGLTSDLSGDPVYHYEYCLAHPALGPDTYGCPPT
jgi:DNA-binding CsgD family transcriptional regulator